MIYKSPKLRLQKCVNIAQQLRNNRIDILHENVVQETIHLIQNLDHLVLPRSQKSFKKKSRTRVSLSPEQHDFLKSTFTENFFLGRDDIDICALCVDLNKHGLNFASIIGEREGTDRESLIWYDASISEVTSSGSE